MSTPFYGEIRMVGEGFAPTGWAKCDGQIIEVRQNEALFSVIGSIYVGDGRNTFGLPDMRGRSPMHEGQGTGLTNRTIGSKVGSETVTIASGEVPSHTQTVQAASEGIDSTDPSGRILGTPGANFYVAPSVQKALHSDTVTTASVLPHLNRQPIMVINFIIAIIGIIPTQT